MENFAFKQKLFSHKLLFAETSEAAKPQNEDSICAEEGLYAVADGKGGNTGGEKASEFVVSYLQESHESGKEIDSNLIHELNNKTVKEFKDAGSTLCLLYFDKDHTKIINAINVGDSRIYKFRKDTLKLISEDQNHAFKLYKSGEVKELDALNKHPSSSELYSYIGSKETIIQENQIYLKEDDIFILCSDGFFEELTQQEIEEMIKAGSYKKTFELVCEKAEDNVSLVAIQFNKSLS